MCTAETLKREALRISDDLGLVGFRASSGYLTNFMKRTGACFRISFSIEFQYFPLLVNSPRKIENSIENEIRKQAPGVEMWYVFVWLLSMGFFCGHG